MPRWLDAGRLYSAELDRRCALALHQGVGWPLVQRVLRICSRLGDGALWIALLLMLPWVGGAVGTHCAWQGLLLGSVNLMIYWALKHGTRRSRPCQQCPSIRACARVPDLFSFPSGHTLHGVAFALLLTAHYPALAPWLWSYAALLGLSRVVLGLHYPSDVLIGALIGVCTADRVLACF